MGSGGEEGGERFVGIYLRAESRRNTPSPGFMCCDLRSMYPLFVMKNFLPPATRSTA